MELFKSKLRIAKEYLFVFDVRASSSYFEFQYLPTKTLKQAYSEIGQSSVQIYISQYLTGCATTAQLPADCMANNVKFIT